MSNGNSYRIRASSFGELFDCALRWEAKHLQGMRMPNSPRALIGTGVHEGTAAFDRAQVGGQIAHGRFESGFGYAHHVVVGHHLLRAVIGQGDQASAVGHPLGGPLGDRDQRVCRHL